MSDADQPPDEGFEFQTDTGPDGDGERSTRLADGEDDDLQIANPEDFEVQRDESGEILPVKQRIPGTDEAILVRPMPPGAFQRWLPVLEGHDESTAKQAEVMREYIVEGPGADATEDYVEERLRGGVVAGLLRAVRNAAGYEVLQGNREQELAENAQALEHLDPEQIQELSSLVDGDARRR